MPDLSYLGATTDIYNKRTSLIKYDRSIEHREKHQLKFLRFYM